MGQLQHVAFVGLGSNLADPVAQVSGALDALGKLPQTRVARRSSLYRSAPVGYLDQPDFINAVAQLETELTPRALLDALLALEQECGRTREFCNAPRTLDLDVLLYDDLIHHEHGLTIPHTQMHLRAFVLQPLLEIAPECVIPGVGPAADAAKACAGQQLEKLV
ncbi:MAG: 2-amino-4-hydroxy-6-hydroxymethyldihydropteridine diphosphokinase [Sideroxyarcus sp.]|nr:2-amino-4-hydroxy-6-hydroxymethyldihydropteridine diphosphokinase [Sideroxyarcus sp.]